MSGGWLLAALPAVPVATALVLAGLRRRASATLGAVAVAGSALTLLVAVRASASEAELVIAWGGDLSLHLAAAGAARVVAPLVPLVAAPVLLYAAGHGERSPARLLAWLSAFVGAMEILVVSADLLTLLIGFELVAVCSWILIGHEWDVPGKAASASRVLLTVRGGDLGLYLAAAAAYAATHSFGFDALHSVEGPLLDVVAAGVLVAAAAKSAQVPFAPWLFEAMEGPTPASALLHSATMVAAGAYALARLAPALEPTGWFSTAVVVVGLSTALAAGAVAALHSDIKKALAASTSAQHGLMLVAIGAGSAAAGVAHLVAHALFKSLLFLGAGMAIHAVATGRLDRMRLGGSLPGAAWIFGIGALALAAVPPLGAAWTKEAVVKAAGHHATWLALGTIVAGLISALYAARLHLLAFGPAGERGGPEAAGGVGPRSGGDGVARPSSLPGIHQRPDRLETVAAAFLAVLTVALGAVWAPGAKPVVEALAGGRLPPGETWETILSLAAVATGIGLAFTAWRKRSLFRPGGSARAGRAAEAWLGLPRLARHGIAVPTLALARTLADFDQRVVDAGVRLAARIGRAVGRTLSWWGEAGFDGAVRGLARGTVLLAAASRATDDRGVDASVEAAASGVGAAGRVGRRIQTGSAHHYLAILFAGLLAAVAFAALGR